MPTSTSATGPPASHVSGSSHTATPTAARETTCRYRCDRQASAASSKATTGSDDKRTPSSSPASSALPDTAHDQAR